MTDARGGGAATEACLSAAPFPAGGGRAAASPAVTAALRRIEAAQAESRLRWFWSERREPPEAPLLMLRDTAEWTTGDLITLQRWWRRQGENALCSCDPEILLLRTDSAGDRVSSLTLCAPVGRGALLLEGLGRPSGAIRPIDDTKEWARFTLTPAQGTVALPDTSIDELITELWGGNRPVLAWRSHFFQLLRLVGTSPSLKDKPPVRPIGPGDAERAYFLQHLQAVITPAAPAAGHEIEWFRKRNSLRSFAFCKTWLDERRIRFRVSRGGDYPQGFAFPLSALRVHFFAEDLLAIEWEIGRDAVDDLAPRLHAPFWPRLFQPQHRGAGLPPLARVIEANARLRHCYSPYASADETPTLMELLEGPDAAPTATASLNFGASVSNGPFAGWFRRLVATALAPFGIDVERLARPFGKPARADDDELRLVMDERARIVTSLVLEGPLAPRTKNAAERFEQLQARLLAADPYGSGFNYKRKFARRELKRGSYRRFADAGSFFAISSHSFVYCGLAGAYAIDPIHRQHMAHPYRRMFLLALFYQAALEEFSRDIGGITRDRYGFAEKLKGLRERFILFANGLWFDAVTPQIQGIELFDLMRRQLRLRALYDEIKEEIEVTDDNDRDQALAELTRRTTSLTKGAFIVSGCALVFAIVALCMQFVEVFEPKGGAQPDSVGWLAQAVHKLANGIAYRWRIEITVAVALIAVFILWVCNRRRTGRTP